MNNTLTLSHQPAQASFHSFFNSLNCTPPKFDREQKVSFLGGVGTIKSYRPTSKAWYYTVEMEMGQEPDFGRVGSETTILLSEPEILTAIC